MPGPVCLVTLPNHLYRRERKSEQYLLSFHPSLTEPTNQWEQPTGGTPQAELNVEILNNETATFNEHPSTAYMNAVGLPWRQNIFDITQLLCCVRMVDSCWNGSPL